MEEPERISMRSLSPNVMNHISPFRGSSRISDYQKTKMKIANINKSLFKQDIDSHPILRLEKAVMRGKGVEKEAKTKTAKKMNITSRFEVNLKKEHKIGTEGTQIVKLPKLPFGHHNTYNEEDYFLDTHFVSFESSPNVAQELRTLSRKLKISDKSKSKRTHSKQNSANSSRGQIIVYEMGNGQLISNMNRDIIDSYEADRSKYMLHHHYVYQTFRDDVGLDSDISLSNKLNSIKKSNDVEGMVRRLYKQPEKKSSELSKELTSKYNLLFDDSKMFAKGFNSTTL